MIEEREIIELIETHRELWDSWEPKSILDALVNLLSNEKSLFYTKLPTRKFFELLQKWKDNTLTQEEEENFSIMLDFELRKKIKERKACRVKGLTIEELLKGI